MGESKFTPGPWIHYADTPSTDPNWHIVTTANKMRVLANVHIEPDNEMDAANARLIAAAPEMYEALEAALDLMEFHHPRPARSGEIARARAALSKARGEG